MRLLVAFKAFWRALWSPQDTRLWLEDKSQEPKGVSEDKNVEGDKSHLRLLSLFQQSGRLIDFLQEDISKYNDAQVGAAVRQLHEQCGQKLEELVTVRPIFEQAEGGTVEVTAGYDPSAIRIVGHVPEAPFKGKLVHKGWRAHKRSLPKQVGVTDVDVIFPAEVEVK